MRRDKRQKASVRSTDAAKYSNVIEAEGKIVI
jgi:hypothetical protein